MNTDPTNQSESSERVHWEIRLGRLEKTVADVTAIVATLADASVRLHSAEERVDLRMEHLVERMADLAITQARADERMAEAQARADERIAEAQARADERIAELAGGQIRFDERLNALIVIIERYITRGNGGASNQEMPPS